MCLTYRRRRREFASRVSRRKLVTQVIRLRGLVCLHVFRVMHVAAAIHLYRHGQRSPYPPPHESSAAGDNRWSTRPLPTAAEWNMTPTDFNRNLLTPNGHALMRHMGEFIARSMGGDPCSLHALLVADGLSQRDLQSAQEFACFPPNVWLHAQPTSWPRPPAHRLSSLLWCWTMPSSKAAVDLTRTRSALPSEGM